MSGSADRVPEVRYAMLRPAQIVTRRKVCPVVYIPLGTLEWHGPHNAVGADTLQAEALALRCAQRGGGLVFPPLYYGESRVEQLMEANAADRALIAREMDLPAENFLPENMPFSAREQVENYHNLLLHILAEAQSLGFRLGVLVAGHGPLIDSARAAALHHNKRRRPAEGRWKPPPMLAWACADWLMVSDRYDNAGDHAGGWETSHMLHLYPQTVDLHALPPKGESMIGVGISGGRMPQDATAEFGKQILDAACEAVLPEVRHRLEHPEHYHVHGMSLAEGLWKK